MRSFVIKGGISTFVSNLEHKFLESIEDITYKSELTERQAELARVLTGRGILRRFLDVDKGIYYVPNKDKGL